jgi:hypothetical protein
LWKSVEIRLARNTSHKRRNAHGGSVSRPRELVAATLRVCSACAGDYEDPERTARFDEPGDEDEEHERHDDDQDAPGKSPVDRE